MDRFLRALPYLLIMVAVVPVLGFLMSGASWRGAWEYTKQWCKYVGAVFMLGILLIVIIWPFS